MEHVMSRNKKYNPNKTKHLIVTKYLTKHALVWCGTKKATFFNLNTTKIHRPSVTTVREIQSTYLNWTVYLCVLLRDKNGKDKVWEDTLYINTPCKAEEIEDYVHDQLHELYTNAPSELRINIGWVATLDPNLTEITITNMFDKMEAFDFLAPFETKI